MDPHDAQAAAVRHNNALVRGTYEEGYSAGNAEGIKEGMRMAAEIAGAEEDQFIALAGEAAESNATWFTVSATTCTVSSYTTTATASGYYYWETPQLSPEEQAQAAAKLQADLEVQERAKRRAETLLLENLSKEQVEQYNRDGHFVVVGGKTGQRYRIRRGRVANVDVVCAKGKIIDRLCAHPNDNVPDCDTMLAQKLILEHEESEEMFMRLANRHGSPNPHQVVLPALH